MKSKGFTLIELLVVIAIIGILASIVLVSFPGATKKAKDSRIVSAIAQARTVMTYINANEGSYSSFSCSYSDMEKLCEEIRNNNPSGTDPMIAATTDAACIYSPLNAKDNYWYCADSTGVAGYTSTDPSTTCNAGNGVYTCPSDTQG